MATYGVIFFMISLPLRVFVLSMGWESGLECGMRQIRVVIALLLFPVLLMACAGPQPDAGTSRVAVLGDSMMAWNGLNGQSVGHVLSDALGEPVTNFAVSGARVNNPLPISSSLGLELKRQFRSGPWKVILVNGGANDFILGCGCGGCRRVLDRLVSADGQTGALPDLMRQLRDTGASVYYVGYHRPRALNSPIRGCKEEVDALEARMAVFARAEQGIRFVDMRDVFPVGDPAYYAADIIHPSPLGSATIGARLAPVIRGALTGKKVD
jgi:lysophospholipase L1-like esterase